MRGETEVSSKLSFLETELPALDEEITTLQMRVKVGVDDWRQIVDSLGRRVERRRALEAQREALRWVLTSDSTNQQERSTMAVSARERDEHLRPFLGN